MISSSNTFDSFSFQTVANTIWVKNSPSFLAPAESYLQLKLFQSFEPGFKLLHFSLSVFTKTLLISSFKLFNDNVL